MQNHNTALKYGAIFFFLSMFLLVSAAIYTLSVKNTTENEDTGIIKDDQLKILNRVSGIEGPALYMDERIQTSLYACNKTKETIHVSSDGVFRKESDPPVLVVIDPATVERAPGCTTLVRMSSGNAASRGLSPGTWHIEGSRVVREGTKELQRITHKSESFQVLAR